eukprot:scaffold2470_cov158-Amphora_coffeaeformis.AAC.4
MSGKGKGKGGRGEKKSTTASAKAGLQFPVGRIGHLLDIVAMESLWQTETDLTIFLSMVGLGQIMAIGDPNLPSSDAEYEKYKTSPTDRRDPFALPVKYIGSYGQDYEESSSFSIPRMLRIWPWKLLAKLAGGTNRPIIQYWGSAVRGTS